MSTFTGEKLVLDQLEHPELRQALSYWAGKKGDRDFPSRNDLSPEDMKPFLRHVLLVDVSYEPLNFVYRVFGTGVALAHRADFTGQSARDLQPPDFADLIWQQYTEVITQRQPLLHRINFDSPAVHADYARLSLPLSSDGDIIDKLLAVTNEDIAFWRIVHANHGRS